MENQTKTRGVPSRETSVWRTRAPTEGHPGNDTSEFLELLNRMPWAECRDFFYGHDELIVTRAPGRLDVMGGIADYSGSLVLQLPIADAVHVALQKTKRKILRIISLPTTASSGLRFFEMPLDQLTTAAGPIDYAEARQSFSRDPKNAWVAYVAGAFLVLMRERQGHFTAGANILIESKVPEGKGVSSSAALEVAVMQAVAGGFNLELPPQELALLCQKVENLIAGAPCGIMDQMTAACGESGRLLELLCQPCDLHGTIALPDELELWGLDSGVRHSVGGSDYTTVRTAAFMGYRIIAGIAGFRSENIGGGKVQLDDPRWHGYLANITPEEFESEYARHLPRLLSGADFLRRYNGTTDQVTSVISEIDYPVAQATRHPIYEHSRVREFAAILKNWEGVAQARRLGELLFQSHQSYSDCGLGSEPTDLLARLVRASAGAELYGARITGGGSGGTVAILGRRGSNTAILEVARHFHESTGHEPLLISGSSAGAAVFGNLKLTREVDNTRSY
jgi:galactokinase